MEGSMYTKFYGLKAKPFRLVPNPAYIYLSSRHQNALTYLEYGLTENVGFIMLTGDIGMGKTTLVRHILNTIEADVEVAVIFNTIVFSNDLLHMILGEFEIEFDAGITKARALELLYAYLIDCYAKGKKVLLIIDEAQNLTNDVLEEIRMISNLQTDDEMLLQIMIVGQPELKEKLRSRALHQFAQRIAVSYHLSPMDSEETQHYIAHRLKIAGGAVDLFDKGAIDIITEASGGIPRLINLLCDACLVYGFADGVKPITDQIVQHVLSDKGGMGLYSSCDPRYEAYGDNHKGQESSTGTLEHSGNMAGYMDDNNILPCFISEHEYQTLCHRVETLEKSMQILQTQVESHITELKSRAEFCRDELVKKLQQMIMLEKSQNLKIAFDYVSRMQSTVNKTV